MGIYEKYILPALTHLVCSQKDIALARKEIVPLAHGNVLEVGMGSGLNLPFYNPGKVKRVWGVEPSDALWQMTDKRSKKAPFEVARVGISGDQIPLDDKSADSAVVTYALCTIPEARKALMEIRRILKPGGELIFCEHGRAPDKYIQKWQDRLNPFWMPISGGCHLNRSISQLIENSGFTIRHMDTKYNSPMKIVSFNYQGIAVPK